MPAGHRPITRTLVLAGVFGCIAVAGCSRFEIPNPDPSPLPPPTTETTSTQPPPDVDFPDLTGFTEAGERYDQTNVPRVQGFYFSTPDGLLCGSNAYPEPQFEYVSCRGPMPAQGPGVWEVTVHRGQPATVESIDGDPGYAADSADPPAVLPPLHKVTASKGDALCAVDDEHSTACRLGDHGFVISPSSTELF
ncbi:hypothetical protein JDV09_18680 [Mycobacterium sp. Y57]|uniref:hypothetical protein n=1 Tax=Mycolicibacterium xanthum TaxID=2796469 RepID=UPI001C861484|nr:hypothetical protein [Mycolicibacterium xanthum]MBX7434125.1 hypothetical protein [Mycolicibacterium xanthum]